MRLEVSELQTGHGREPEGTVVNEERDGRRVCAAICAGGSKDAVAMTVE